ncbi:MAG: phosphatidate cytidylyltransferase [Ignavibacteriales bacterium]|nr:phosphatidate cytidylyltransferase [Ignavibacteriales bacterium]
MSNLLSRVLVAIVAIPAILYICFAGGWLFFGFVLLLTIIGLLEFYKLAEAKELHPQKFLGIALGISVISFFAKEMFNDVYNYVSISIFTFSFIILIVELFRNKENALQNLSTTIFGVVYVAGSFGMLLGLREIDFSSQQENSGYVIIAILISIWMCDSLAYFGGKTFGKHKLFERVSPKKTWEGAIAGLLGVIIIVPILHSMYLRFLSHFDMLVFAVVIGVFGQIGDLFESLLKRDANVKDSSAIIPGHGGVLDRFDNLLFSVPILYVYFKMFN